MSRHLERLIRERTLIDVIRVLRKYMTARFAAQEKWNDQHPIGNGDDETNHFLGVGAARCIVLVQNMRKRRVAHK